MQYEHIVVPPNGRKITINTDLSLKVPDKPIIPYIEGDGIGIDVTPALLRYLRTEANPPHLGRWEELVHRIYNPQDEVKIAIVGKYVEYEDSYKSLKEALVHGATGQNFRPTPLRTRYAAVRSTMRTMSAMMRLSSKSLGV